METGQVKTGENTSDTYTKMLQEMVRVTLPVAIGIATEYPTVQQLVKGLERHGPTALEECRKSSNSDGAFTNKRVGKAISKRVYDVFMGTDPGSWDV
jgi:crossover junction endonuclease EME1